MLATSFLVIVILCFTLVGYAWVTRHYSRVTITFNHRGKRCHIVLPSKEDLEDALRSLPPPWSTAKDTIVVSEGRHTPGPTPSPLPT